MLDFHVGGVDCKFGGLEVQIWVLVVSDSRPNGLKQKFESYAYNCFGGAGREP